jgi:hypothetical protein
VPPSDAFEKNEAMNRSIMRYCPKDKTYCKTMVLTSRISIAIGIDTLGHAGFYEELFESMNFTTSEMTFSGLRQMSRKKEYGQSYSGLASTNRRRRINQRDRMIDGMQKMEEDAKYGRGYSSGIHMQDENKDSDSGSPRKKARLASGKTKECKCGKKDHMRVSSRSCPPWRGLSKLEVTRKYALRLAENDLLPHYANRSEPTAEPTSECTGNVERELGESEEHVQSTSKYFGAPYESTKYDIEAHVNSPGTVSIGMGKERNSICQDPLPSVNDISDIAENESKENAIFIAQTEIDWLDDLSLEGDVPDNVSDMK